MVGRTRLYQSLGSPLIQGATRPPSHGWRYVALLVAVTLIVLAVVYLVFVR